MITNNSPLIDGKLIFNNPFIAIIILDKDGTIEDINDKALSILGYSKSILTGIRIDTLLTGETSLKLIKEKYVEGILGMINILGNTCLFDYHYQKSTRFHRAYLSMHLINDNATPPYAKDSVFKEVFQMSQSGLCIVDETYAVIDVNKTFCELTRLTKEQLLDRNIFDYDKLFFHSNERKRSFIKEITQSGFVNKISCQIRASDGELVPVLVSIEELYLDQKCYWLAILENTPESDASTTPSIYKNLPDHIENSNLGLVEYDAQFNIVFWNQRCEAIFGWTSNELISSKISAYDLIHPEDLQKVSQLTDDLLSGAVNGNMSFHRNHTKDGRMIQCIWHNSVVKNEKGEVISIMSLVEDISAQKELTKELQASSKYLDLFFNNSLSGFFFMMLDEPVEWNQFTRQNAVIDYVFDHQRITRANQAILNQYQVKEADFIGITPKNLFSHDLKKGKEIWKDFFNKGHMQITTRERRQDGTEFWVEGEYKLLYDEQGRIAGHFGIQHDITDRKINQREREQAATRFHLMTRSAHLGVFEWNIVTNSISVSDLLRELLNIPEDSTVTTLTDWMSWVHPNDASRFIKFLNRVVTEEKEFEGLFRVIGLNNTLHHLEIMANVTKDENSSTQKVIGVCRDLTKKVDSQRRMDQAILAAQEDERREIGRELHDHVMQLMATSAMYLHHVNDHPEESAEALKKSLQLMELAIRETRQLSHRLTPANLESSSIEEEFQELINSFNFKEKYTIQYHHNVDNMVELSPEIKLHLYRILQEQLNNIVKHAKASIIKVYLTACPQKVRLAIMDNGVGFDVKKVRKGIGVKNIQKRVEIMLGDMKISSSPNNGCKTIITIPLDRA